MLFRSLCVRVVTVLAAAAVLASSLLAQTAGQPSQVSPASEAAGAWLDQVKAARAVSRLAVFRSLVRVQLMYESGTLAPGLPPTAARDVLTRAAVTVGLQVVPAAAGRLVVALRTGPTYTVQQTTTMGSDTSLVHQVFAEASLQVPADVLRDNGVRPTTVALASVAVGALEVGDEIKPATAEALLRQVITLLSRDAALADEATPDGEWQAWIESLRPRAAELYRQAGVPRVELGRAPSLAGVSRIARVDVGPGPFNELPALALQENFLGTGLRTWDPETTWYNAFRGVVDVGSGRIAPAYLPTVRYRLSGTAVQSNRVGGASTDRMMTVGETVLVEPNCLVQTPAGMARVTCRTWMGASVSSGFPSKPGESHWLSRLDVEMSKDAAALAAALGRGKAVAGPELSLLPRAASTPRTAYDLLNLNKRRAQHEPLIYQTPGRDIYIAGLTPDGSQFRVIAVPLRNIREMITELEASLARYRGQPNATVENLRAAVKSRFESYAFAMDSYPNLFRGTSDFPNAASRAVVLNLEDVDLPKPGAPAATPSPALASAALPSIFNYVGPRTHTVSVGGDCLALVDMQSGTSRSNYVLDFRTIDLNSLTSAGGVVRFNGRRGNETVLVYGNDPAGLSQAEKVSAFVRARTQQCRSTPLTLANVPRPVLHTGTPIYEYGTVPEEFVPPLPDNITRETTVMMSKDRPGSLYQVTVGSFARFATFSGLDLQNERKWGSLTSIISEDTAALYASFDATKTYLVILECRYNNAPLQFFWYKARPAQADSVALRARAANHPFLQIGPPLSSCPTTAPTPSR